MKDLFPNFRYLDFCVVLALVIVLAMLSYQHPDDHIWRDAGMPVCLIVGYALGRWRR